MTIRRVRILVGTTVIFIVAFLGPARVAVAAGTCLGEKANIKGTAGSDVLVGTNEDDIIAGEGGNDIIRGGGGDDLICGGPGQDTIFGGSGDDDLNGDEDGDFRFSSPFRG
jgi:Ca2+-binding RTX toxin-like protein